MNKPLKILLLTDGIYPFSVGGIQKHSSGLAKVLLSLGHEVTLVFCVASFEDIPSNDVVFKKLNIPKSDQNRLDIIGFHFPAPGKFPGHYIRNSYRYSKAVFEYLNSRLFQFDFIYAQGFTAWYTLEQKKKGALIPEIGINFHGLNMFQKTFGFKNKLVSRMFKKPVKHNLEMADLVFSFGGIFSDIYKTLKVDHKTFFHPIGIHSEDIASPSDLKNNVILRFVFIGRNDVVKGLRFLSQAIRNLPENSFEFHFIGEINEDQKLKRKDCFYYGTLLNEELKKRLSLCDVLISSSISEGMPMVVLEAMANGLAIISTNVGAVPELVNTDNGFLIKPGNAGEIVRAINYISSMNKEELLILKLKSIEKAQHFTWTHVGENLVQKIYSLLEKKQHNN